MANKIPIIAKTIEEFSVVEKVLNLFRTDFKESITQAEYKGLDKTIEISVLVKENETLYVTKVFETYSTDSFYDGVLRLRVRLGYIGEDSELVGILVELKITNGSFVYFGCN